MTVMGSFSLSACSRSTSMTGASTNDVRRRPRSDFFEYRSRVARISPAIRSHCRSSDLMSAWSSRLCLDLGQLELADQLGLRLIVEADDANDLVDVEVGDEIAVQNLEPVLDLLQAELGA